MGESDILNTARAGEVEALIATVYRAVLRREPDPGGMATYSAALREGRDVGWLLEHLLASDEYGSLSPRSATRPTYPLDRAPAMRMDARWHAVEHQAIWDHLASVWSRYGETEPHWSVITDERFRADKIGDNRALFDDSGVREVERLDAWLSRNGVSAQGICAEYGCGVGRVTTALAGRFQGVLGFDISAPHLKVARERLDSDGVENVELVHVRSAAQLDRLTEIDLFYSVIVLQHSPPPIIVDVLDRAFAGLNAGGVAFFQAPTYGLGYEFSAERYQSEMTQVTDMEMHFLPQQVVFDLARRHGVHVIEVQPDDWTGNSAHWISTTFLLRKPSGAEAAARPDPAVFEA